MSKGNLKHGYFGTPTYKSWSEMKYRCENKSRKYYVDISYCKEWESFENFLADMGERPKGKSIDRIDNNGNYEPKNCRWATPKEQANNKRNNHLFECKGEKLTLTNWSKKLGIKRSTLAQRIYCYKWSIEKSFKKGGDYFGRS